MGQQQHDKKILQDDIETLLRRTLVAEQLLQNISLFQRTDHERILRLESMLAYQLELQPATVTAKPNTDQARALAAMGLPAWQKITRDTNQYQLWMEGYERKLREAELRAQLLQNGGIDEKA